MAKRIRDLEGRKTIHVGVNSSSHAGFRIQCFKYGLSMQEVFEEFVVRIANEDTDSLEFLAELKSDKKLKTVKKLKNIDVESIYDMINSENPISDDE
tara:strand:- start:138 stop:428 length:291 start_codon:yes stop_codon:yes gene_type:complete